MLLKADRSGERIDAALARLAPELSRSAAQKLFEGGGVLLNGRPARKSDRLSEGDTLELTLPEVQEVALEAENIPLDIVYEDADVIVVNKPKGLVVHPAAGHWSGTLVNALMYHCRDSLSGIGGELRPGIVHRIDKDTSGLLIAAKNDHAHRALAAQLKDHTLADRKKMCVTKKDGREAVTHWRVLERFPGYTLLECRLETGRTHQIRVHLAWRSHPILGDTVYGHRKPELGMDTQCLHARELTFLHPRTGERVTVQCELPDYFQELLQKLRQKT